MTDSPHGHSLSCRVGIGIPMRNEVATVEASIFSALSQSHRATLVYVSDNASDDGSLARILPLAGRHEQIRVHQHRQPIPAPENFIHVASVAEDECCFFMWLGAHDWIPSDYVSVLLEVLVERGATLAVPLHSIGVELSDVGAGIAERLESLRPQFSRHDSITDEQFPSKQLQAKFIVDELQNCTPLHGLWDMGRLRTMTFLDTAAADHSVLFQAALDGPVVHGATVYVRGKPPGRTASGKRARYRENGIRTGYRAMADLAHHSYRLVLSSSNVVVARRRFALYVGLMTFFRLSPATITDKAFVRFARFARRALSYAGRRFDSAMSPGPLA